MSLRAEISACPYRDLVAGVCRAATSPQPLESRRLKYYCNNDNHDNCVLFLAKALRASRPLTYDRQNCDHCLK